MNSRGVSSCHHHRSSSHPRHERHSSTSSQANHHRHHHHSRQPPSLGSRQSSHRNKGRPVDESRMSRSRSRSRSRSPLSSYRASRSPLRSDHGAHNSTRSDSSTWSGMGESLDDERRMKLLQTVVAKLPGRIDDFLRTTTMDPEVAEDLRQVS